MMWDMSNWELIRLVDTLNEKIVDLRACWITGDIFVASEKSISVFTINGTPLGKPQLRHHHVMVRLLRNNYVITYTIHSFTF